MVRVFLERENRTESIGFEGSAKELCDKMGVNVQTVVIVKNNGIITESDDIKDNDEVKLLSVISGG